MVQSHGQSRACSRKAGKHGTQKHHVGGDATRRTLASLENTEALVAVRIQMLEDLPVDEVETLKDFCARLEVEYANWLYDAPAPMDENTHARVATALTEIERIAGRLLDSLSESSDD